MKKSYNDIYAQLDRVIKLARERGRYIIRKTGKVNEQHLHQVAGRTLSQHGISRFTKDRDERKELVNPPQRKVPAVVVSKTETVVVSKPLVKDQPKDNKNLVNAKEWFDNEQNRKQMQVMCRHAFIKEMFKELLADMAICKHEGWDIYEYPRMIRKEIERCLPQPKQLTLF